MPLIQANGIRQYYRLDGRENRPVLIFSHALGCDHTVWDAQAGALAPHFRLLRYDLRGHGATEAPAGDYSIELLGRDLLALADSLAIERFAFCGLSLGGMIGQWLGANAGDCVTSLVLANTSSQYEAGGPMESRRRTVVEQGIGAIEATVMGRFFSPETLAAPTPAVESVLRVLHATDPAGYAGCCAAIRDMRQTEMLARISAPTLVVIGDQDQSTPANPHGDTLARHIPNAKAEHLPAAHLSPVERPRSFTTLLMRFLLPPEADTLDAGFRRRREILGSEHVDRAIANTTPFNAAFQQLITNFAWGTIWNDPALDDRTRRLLVLTATAALGRWEEFRLHVRTGLMNGLEPCDIEQTLLQLAVYAGVPPANTGFHIAAEEMARS